MLLVIDFVNKIKYLIIFLSFAVTAQASCKIKNPASQTCPIQKLIVSEEEITPTVLVFASFSMPEETLKQLAIDLKKINGALVIRGLINNSFKDTSFYLQKLDVGVLLDPTLFEKFNVKSVPTFIITEGDLKSEQTPKHDRLQGNVSLKFVLERSVKEGDIQTKFLLEKLQGSI